MTPDSNDNLTTAELTITGPGGVHTSISVTRSSEWEALSDLWRLIAPRIREATGTAADNSPHVAGTH